MSTVLPPSRIRNIAIIAHVDHGKTTLVDQLLRQSGTLDAANSDIRVMDSNALEKERGITILSKCTSINYKDYRINIVDTPGHADFGGEVERVLSLVDSVAVVVDAQEGPMTQTRFVLRKALERGLKPIVVLNKADRPTSRPEQVDSDLLDLFATLGASDEQMEYPMLLASAKAGWAITYAGGDWSIPTKGSMTSLFEAIVEHTPPPKVDPEGPFNMLVTQLESDAYLGACYIGKIYGGSVTVGQKIKALTPEGDFIEEAKVTKVYSRIGLANHMLDAAGAGDIVGIAGVVKGAVNATFCDPSVHEAIPITPLDPPTVSMLFAANDSPLQGQEGSQLTSTMLATRLLAEARTNIALTVTPLGEQIEVCGRGVLHLGILIETMRREGYEMSISPPRAVLKQVDGKVHEPVEEVVIDVAIGDVGVVMDKLTKRKGELTSMVDGDEGRMRITMQIPSRGLMSYVAGEFKTDTHGQGILNSSFVGYEPYKGPISTSRKGSLISTSAGPCTTFALEALEPRGVLFVSPREKVYEGMIVGEHSKAESLEINPTKAKALTNMRSVNKDEFTTLKAPRRFTLEEVLAFVGDDEKIEVTPSSLRLRKAVLNANARKQQSRRKEKIV
ncbi:GTP-binding protein TypA [Protomyces lactucae-debilis]|uniref:GTP-binding protein TypA n=1 Tax=Protomyces lactucae-debilis TaxID=2754530 RepID=A0A1Y2F6H2_PROLT|nr:GTP-binding protein TypA [Protomyces lactucae-debilis]ORY78936.1 GTP-binding protein TypA [Protomyces lactucae-debilis]